MASRPPVFLLAALCMTHLWGCASSDAPDDVSDRSAPRAGTIRSEQEVHAHGFATHTLLRGGAPDATLHTGARHFSIFPETPVWQIGLMLQGTFDDTPPVMWRARGVDGVWTGWLAAEITWTEGERGVGRIALSEPGTDIELRLDDGLTHASAELFDSLRATRPVLARDLPLAAPLLTRTQALAPASLVTPRATWGARDPGKICGSVVTPYRVSVHHTSLPDSDDGDPAARLRQMQAYHMDSNGWCDIGYHFVVSQSGEIFQGRSDEQRPGAHVGNQNAGNIGVSFIGNYERDQPGQIQIDAGRRILDWIRTTYDITWDTEHVKGHQQWPGQSTDCPGKNLLAKLPELMTAPTDPVDPVDPVDPLPDEIRVAVNVLAEGAPLDLLTQGSSLGILDALQNTTFATEIVLSNRTVNPLRGVTIAYTIEEPFLTASSYVIESDAPALDGSTWVINDADSAPDNPARDAIGAAGEFTLYALSAGESKRVRLDLSAPRYSLGATDHPDVRMWVKHIDGVYESQTEWDVPPAIQETDALLQAELSFDVISGTQWQFDAGEPEMTEGWESCAGEIAVRVDVGALTLPSTSGCIASPAWTGIDAGTWDQLVLRMQSNDVASTLEISWAGDGDVLGAAERRLFINLPAQNTSRLLVIPMSEAPTWAGDISALRLRTLAATQQAGDLSLDAIYMQSSTTKSTSAAPDATYAEIPLTPVSVKPPEGVPTEVIPTPTPGSKDPVTPTPGTMTPDAGMTDSPDMSGEDEVRVNDGCATTAPAAPQRLPGGIVLCILGGLGVFWRRLRA